LKAARLLGRNWPLVLLLVLIGMLYWPGSEAEVAEPEEREAPRKPNGAHPPSPNVEARV
jgi:hypothetical protein